MMARSLSTRLVTDIANAAKVIRKQRPSAGRDVCDWTLESGMAGDRALRVGLIGMGAVGLVHLKAYERAARARVVAIADVSAERLSAAPAGQSVKRYSDAEQMLRAEQPDIACVLTTVPTHEPLVALCAARKVNVLCEKPLTLSVAGAERMLGAARKAGVRLCYGSSYRHLPAVKAAAAIVASGALGDVRLMREQAIGGKGPEGVQVMSPHHYPPGGPGGTPMGIVDHGIHLIDVFSQLARSPVKRVTGHGNVAGAPPGPEHMTIEYESGSVGQLAYDEATYPTEMPSEGVFSLGQGWDLDGFVPAGHWTRYPGSIHVYGTKGSLRIFHYANQLYQIDHQGLRQIPIEGPAAPYHFATQIDTFAEDILTGRPTTVPGEAGLDALRTMLAVYSR